MEDFSYREDKSCVICSILLSNTKYDKATFMSFCLNLY